MLNNQCLWYSIDFNIPETVKDEEQLNKDAAKWKYTSHKRRGDWTGKPIILGYFTGDLIGFNWPLSPLRKGKKKERERERKRIVVM